MLTGHVDNLSMKLLFKSFANFKNCPFFKLVRVHYTFLNKSPVTYTDYKYYLPIYGLPFASINMSFDEQKFYIIYFTNLFSYTFLCLVESLLPPRSLIKLHKVIQNFLVVTLKE